MSVKERDVEQFQQALKIYTDATCSQLNNLQYVSLSASFPCLPQDLSVTWNCYTFSKHMTHNPRLPASVSFQCFSPEPARQVMLHHVWILAGPSLLDEVGSEWLHGILGYRNHMLMMSLHWTLSGMHRLKYFCLAGVTGCLIRFINLPFSATCSRPSVRPSSAALSTHWKSQRWSPPCSSQVETSPLNNHL